MAAINNRGESGTDYIGFNSGIMLSILRDTRVKSEVAQQLIHEWCQHVSQIFEYFVIFYARLADNFYYMNA